MCNSARVQICQHCRVEIVLGEDPGIVKVSETLCFPLKEFVGLTLKAMSDLLLTRIDMGQYCFYPCYNCRPIRNDRFIDRNPEYPNSKNYWKKDVLKNEYGWAGKDEGITEDYVVQNGDEGLVQVSKYYHARCYGKMLENTDSDANPNLARVDYCDYRIEKELSTAGIIVINGKRSGGEVFSAITGKLGLWTFYRVGCYWVARCKQGGLPLDLAEKMHVKPYPHSCDKKYGDVIRVAGHCGSPPPGEWARDFKGGKAVVLYHVDTQEGLNELARMIRESWNRLTD